MRQGNIFTSVCHSVQGTVRHPPPARRDGYCRVPGQKTCYCCWQISYWNAFLFIIITVFMSLTFVTLLDTQRYINYAEPCCSFYRSFAMLGLNPGQQYFRERPGQDRGHSQSTRHQVRGLLISTECCILTALVPLYKHFFDLLHYSAYSYRPQTKLRKGTVFTPVCDSVHRGAYTPGRQPPPEMATAADGMHPTGIHSCFSS